MAVLAQPPAPVPTGNDIPTYYQVPETTYDCMFASHSLIRINVEKIIHSDIQFGQWTGQTSLRWICLNLIRLVARNN